MMLGRRYKSVAMDNIGEYTLESWLQGKVAFTITSETINSICFDRQAEPGCAASEYCVKTRELCLADLYMWCASLPTSTATIDDRNGNWEHKEGSVTLSGADKKHYRMLANRLYKKWGEYHQPMSSINFRAQGMGLRRNNH